MIEVEEGEADIAVTIESFRSLIRTEAAETHIGQMGHKGGRLETDIYWLPQLDIWAAFRERENRYWMMVQVNLPVRGVDRHTEGAVGLGRDGTRSCSIGG